MDSSAERRAGRPSAGLGTLSRPDADGEQGQAWGAQQSAQGEQGQAGELSRTARRTTRRRGGGLSRAGDDAGQAGGWAHEQAGTDPWQPTADSGGWGVGDQQADRRLVRRGVETDSRQLPTVRVVGSRPARLGVRSRRAVSPGVAASKTTARAQAARPRLGVRSRPAVRTGVAASPATARGPAAGLRPGVSRRPRLGCAAVGRRAVGAGTGSGEGPGGGTEAWGAQQAAAIRGAQQNAGRCALGWRAAGRW